VFNIIGVDPLITELASRIIKASEKTSSSEEEFIKQKKELALLEDQAKVAQEVAIANRIESATEVEIEEYYGNIGDGTVGVSSREGAVTLGVGGSKQNVTKRVYKFSGMEPIVKKSEDKK